MTRIGLFFYLLLCFVSHAQSPWPSENWNAATPITSVMNASGLLELSGLHWNPELNRLYVVHGDGRLRVLQLNTVSNTFTQIGNKSISGGPEGITQANYSANEFYTIDENNYEIRKFTHSANFGTITFSKHWDLLASPSPMEDTGNSGPEGIVFVPDASLAAIGFTSSQTGLPYTSVKGAGGLFFVAHQDGGYIWAFDINPNVNDDFAYVGKYKTSRNESCDLAFDRSTGLLYVLHNVGSNYIEVTDLSLAAAPGGEAKFTTVSEYFISNPSDGNSNIEGFAITPKCPETGSASAWLCRDVESGEDDAIMEDAIRWFSPFALDGNCAPLKATTFQTDIVSIYPNPGIDAVTIGIEGDFSAEWINVLGQSVLICDSANGNTVDVSSLQSGIYVIEIKTAKSATKIKWIKN